MATTEQKAALAFVLPPVRDEFELQSVIEPSADVECPLPLHERILQSTLVRRLVVVGLLAAAWEGYATYLDNSLMMPRLSEVVVALVSSLVSGGLAMRILLTMKVLVIGYAAGITAAATITILASTTRFGSDVLSTLTSMFNPLPAVALLPLALLWFGLGMGSLVFVIINSVLWAVALSTHTGFQSVSETLRMAGRCFGLRGLSLVAEILIPAALPSILAGLKIGWAFAWRTLIAAELVFGVSSGQGGLGWFIYENRNNLETANVFAGLLCVILIGLFVESVIFRTIERKTIRRWGMQKF
ncbi:NitT/TauT family transport system permease protein [Bradyrhizobium japonicum]|jgi:NitT/TauT family transport system permease protein|uniref:ABC transporter permease n=1 Tax=Bradyrhizobium TaxID=374 RepID=UPI00067619C1|nr:MULTISPECIES: ABC transporter permease subunit [Bradyrhizobium]MBR0880892.1 ABC transporter permease subunit [Bradyrhizobium liaoningense]MBR1001834.1 ABC transporter permease subunit [Bradyrhizobium liaoningense]MBR1068185.1 ABC transporter permease subunit [Bradyrhizobium liaoningense]MCP1744879.1 NitT/TauT family transport system permease protein [Bradyrhizobium japonicum]MCP1783162.1 NitT/TauT family transport system permease protein [Bradyrhizobium japonicum]